MATKEKDSITAYMGRFNPFHNGHAHVLTRALQSSKLVILLLGSAGLARSLKNPFTFEERKDIIRRWYTEEIVKGRIDVKCQLVIAPLRDYPYNDAMWIRNVQSTVKSVIEGRDPDWLDDPVRITGSDRDESTWYLKALWRTLAARCSHARTGKRSSPCTAAICL